MGCVHKRNPGDYKGMTTRKQEPNISRKFCNYDYVVQLSDTELFVMNV